MSLLSELDGAELVVADEALGILFAWYGGAGVQILNERGDVLDAFSISAAFSRNLTVAEVRKFIAAYREDLLSEDDS
jgi:hypothetical protein